MSQPLKQVPWEVGKEEFFVVPSLAAEAPPHASTGLEWLDMCACQKQLRIWEGRDECSISGERREPGTELTTLHPSLLTLPTVLRGYYYLHFISEKTERDQRLTQASHQVSEREPERVLSLSLKWNRISYTKEEKKWLQQF